MVVAQKLTLDYFQLYFGNLSKLGNQESPSYSQTLTKITDTIFNRGKMK